MQRPPVIVERTVLEGRTVRLEPAESHHAHGLAQYATPETFRYFAWPFPEGPTAEALSEHIRLLRMSATDLQYVVVLRSTNEPIGSSSYLEIRREHLGLEIGRTWYAEAHRGTLVNPETKLLLLQQAFESIGCLRVQLKTDLRNVHSQAAIEKLGARKEGVLRSHVQMPDGHMRDTVMYSVLANEWPEVKRGLQARLESEVSR